MATRVRCAVLSALMVVSVVGSAGSISAAAEPPAATPAAPSPPAPAEKPTAEAPKPAAAVTPPAPKATLPSGVDRSAAFSQPWWAAPRPAIRVLRDGASVEHDHTTTLPSGRTATTTSTLSRDGNVVTRDAVRFGPVGMSTAQDSWTRGHDSVTREGLIVLPDGTQVSRDATIKRNQDGSITRDMLTVGSDGRGTSVESTVTRDGNTVSIDSVRTLPDGRAVMRDTDITREGDTVTRESTLINPDGTVILTTDTWNQMSTSPKRCGTPDGPAPERSTLPGRSARTPTRGGMIVIPRNEGSSPPIGVTPQKREPSTIQTAVGTSPPKTGLAGRPGLKPVAGAVKPTAAELKAAAAANRK